MNILTKKPEEVDALIMGKINQFPKKGAKGSTGRTKWTDEELHLRDSVIMAYITENGLSRERTAQQIAARWNISMTSARRYVKDAVERFCATFDDDYERLRKVFLERVENLYTSALDDNQKDIAKSALDMMGKAVGAYTEKKDINVSGNLSIDFDFE